MASLAIALAGCAAGPDPILEPASMLERLNAGYEPLAPPASTWPYGRLEAASVAELAAWLTPDRQDKIEAVRWTTFAPMGSSGVELIETGTVVRPGLCRTAVSMFISSAHSPSSTAMFSGHRTLLFRATDADGGCTLKPDRPIGFSAISPDEAQGFVIAFRDATSRLDRAGLAWASSFGGLAPDQISRVGPCDSVSRCLEFDLQTDADRWPGWRLTYRYGSRRSAVLEPMPPTTPF